MDITKHFKSGIDIFKDNYLEAILGLIIVGLISGISLGILSPVMYTGYNMMLLNAKRGKKISINDTFLYMNKFFSLWGVSIIMGIILGLLAITIIGIIPAIFLWAWWMYSCIFVADKDQNAFKAMDSSAALVRKNNVWLHILFFVIVFIISQLGFYVFFIGGLITTPIAIGAFVSAYDDLNKKGAARRK